MKLSTRSTKDVPITIVPEIRFGKPIITGTRVSVQDILMLLESGYRIDEIPEQYPQIKLTDAKKAVHYAAALLGTEELFSLHE